MHVFFNPGALAGFLVGRSSRQNKRGAAPFAAFRLMIDSPALLTRK